MDVWISEWLSIASVDIAVDIAAGIAADANDIIQMSDGKEVDIVNC